ncbi:hypothetical protein LTR50_005841 [Elasticomyces elasticus]|nr:hypothetical protein LTR50_005841 [Elasticomyces elasticus]
MDFASIMSAEISKAMQTASKNDPTTTEPKYVKRSEVEAQRVANYRAEQAARESARLEKENKKRKFEEEEDERKRVREEKRRRLWEESRKLKEEEEEAEVRKQRKRLGLPQLSPKVKDGEKGEEGRPLPTEEDVPDAELTLKLRELGEPIKLFGESHKARLKRWRRLTGKDVDGTLRPTLSKGPIPTTLGLLPEAEMKVPAALPTTPEGRQYLFRQLASYFTMVLSEWQTALAKRDESVKNSYQGKAAYNAMVQARENMRPLFKKLEKGELEDGILEPVVEIVKAAQERRYVDANDGYLRLSIGKAAWPIGVTMVGIHERSAREKLHESDKNAAHIMSDELTRKYLQSIKRCLSYAQTRWPPDDHMQLMG